MSRPVMADTVEECDRVIRLINNLLVLARADRPRVLGAECCVPCGKLRPCLGPLAFPRVPAPGP